MIAARPRVGVPSVTVGDTMSAVADELERIRTLGLRIEGAICAVAVRSSVDAALIGELQQLDAMLQHVAALRDFLGTLANQPEADAALDTSSALERVTLGEVRSRLGGDAGDADEGWEML